MAEKSKLTKIALATGKILQTAAKIYVDFGDIIRGQYSGDKIDNPSKTYGDPNIIREVYN